MKPMTGLRVLFGITAILWLCNFIALFFGYEPGMTQIGLAYFMTFAFFAYAAFEN